METSAYFSLSAAQANETLAAGYEAVHEWCVVALGSEVGLRRDELDDFVPAFEHEVMEEARRLLGRAER